MAMMTRRRLDGGDYGGSMVGPMGGTGSSAPSAGQAGPSKRRLDAPQPGPQAGLPSPVMQPGAQALSPSPDAPMSPGNMDNYLQSQDPAGGQGGGQDQLQQILKLLAQSGQMPGAKNSY